ncbi:MAG: hypothetical protein IPL49_18135 [Saprospirales bacterium]|nr:hypothetical protein [Saprospirales bacterium]
MMYKMLFVIVLSTVWMSCDDLLDISIDPVESVAPDFVEGEWTVKKFKDGLENETSSFAGIVLVFNPNGIFEMRQGADLIADGSWGLTDGDQRLDIRVPAFANEDESLGEDLYEVADDWRLHRISDDEMHLKGGNESFELLRQ